VPEWNALARRLADLASAAGAVNAVVGDSAGALFCRAFALDRDGQLDAQSAIEQAAADRRRTTPRPPRRRFVATWFDGVYVLLLFVPVGHEPARLRALIEEALPTLRRLTVALPPPDGPDATTGAAAKRSA
jgi:hypothetical protein